MMNSMDCQGSTYQKGKAYDFYFINLTPDTHPIHIHLTNMQFVKRYLFDVQNYTNDYFKANGGLPGRSGFSQLPIKIDPEPYRNGTDVLPANYEMLFRDTIDMKPGYVTVVRISFTKNDGTLWKSFNLNGQRYVMHCHILEHEDN
jgi:spore coat protein A